MSDLVANLSAHANRAAETLRARRPRGANATTVSTCGAGVQVLQLELLAENTQLESRCKRESSESMVCVFVFLPALLCIQGVSTLRCFH